MIKVFTVKPVLLFFLIFTGSIVLGQTPTPLGTRQINNMLPHSPEAEAMANYTALPVSLYTGMPELSVPVFVIKGKSLTVPITLSYHYNGFRPSEMASAAGLGWNVQGGGVISRIVKGRVDHEDFHVSGFDYDDFANMYLMVSGNQDKLKLMLEGYADGEPDIFVFNAPGLSGKFILLGGKAYTFPYQDIKIEGSATGSFTITGTNGDHYYFEESETTHHHQLINTPYVPDHKSSWYLTRIVSADLADTVNYAYSTYNYRAVPVLGNTYTINTSNDHGTNPNDIQTPSSDYIANDSISDAKQLSSINYKGSSIVFYQSGTPRQDGLLFSSPMYAYDSICVIEGDMGTYRTYRLNHRYFNSKLNLTGVDVWGTSGSDSSGVQRYRFEYENEDTSRSITWWLSKSIDKWGYYNGANNSNSLMFTAQDLAPYNTPYTGLGNRTPSQGYAQTNIIKKVTYPTGGYTTFEYEQNAGIGDGEAGPGLRIKKIRMYAAQGLPTPSLEKDYVYGTAMVNYKNGAEISTVHIHGGMCAPQACAGDRPPAPIDKDRIVLSTTVNSPLSDLISTPFYYSSVTEINRADTATGRTRYEFYSFYTDDPDVYLYRQTDEAYRNGSFTKVRQVTNDYSDTVLFHFQTVIPKQTDEWYNPDLSPCYACAELNTIDPVQQAQLVPAYYEATVGNDYTSAYKKLQQVTVANWEEGSSTPLINTTKYYYESHNHPYPTRIVTTNSKGELLTTRMRYPLDYLPSGTTPKYVLDSAFEQQRFDLMNSQSRRRDSLITLLQPYSPYSSATQTGFKHIVDSVNWENTYRNATTALYAMRDAGWNTYYTALETAQSAQPVAWLKAVYWMQQHNLFTPVIEKLTTLTKTDGTEYLLQASRNEFALQDNANSMQVPVLAHVSETELSVPVAYASFLLDTAQYYRQQVHMEYDANLNLVSQWKTNDVKQSFLWGNGNRYPVAVVTGADYATIAGLVNLGTINNTDGDETAVRNEVNQLRMALAGSKAQVTGYTYKTLTGELTSQTDTNGRTTYYLYDVMGRLEAVKDKDGNIIKTFQYHYQQ